MVDEKAGMFWKIDEADGKLFPLYIVKKCFKEFKKAAKAAKEEEGHRI